MAGYGQNQYLKTQVTTVDGVKLIVLLYEGAIKFLLSAQEGIREKDIVKRHNNIYRVLDIIAELRNSLNFSQGGEIATSLNALYQFMEGHLMTANIQNDAQMIQEVVNILSSLKEAWQTIASRPEVRKAAEAPGRTKGIRI
jgi:flagellar secretion chaperone FliS